LCGLGTGINECVLSDRWQHPATTVYRSIEWRIKKWTILFFIYFVAYNVYTHHTHTENFYNISTVPKTLIKVKIFVVK